MKKNYDNILWGLLLVLIAVYLIGNKLGLLSDISLLAGVSLFDLLLGIVFLIFLIKGLGRLKFGQIFFSLAFLGIIFDDQLHITAITPWTILIAALLLTIALNMIFPKSSRNMISGQKKVTFSSDAGNLEGENLFFRLTFGDATKYVKSDNFKYGSFNCSFGDLDVYLNDVMINESSATIDVDVKFGKLTIYVPRNWRVNCQANKNFGEIHVDGLGNASADAKALIIRGDVNFGELRIIYI